MRSVLSFLLTETVVKGKQMDDVATSGVAMVVILKCWFA